MRTDLMEAAAYLLRCQLKPRPCKAGWKCQISLHHPFLATNSLNLLLFPLFFPSFFFFLFLFLFLFLFFSSFFPPLLPLRKQAGASFLKDALRMGRRNTFCRGGEEGSLVSLWGFVGLSFGGERGGGKRRRPKVAFTSRISRPPRPRTRLSLQRGDARGQEAFAKAASVRLSRGGFGVLSRPKSDLFIEKENK